MTIPIFPFFGGLNGDPDVPDRDFEDLFEDEEFEEGLDYEDDMDGFV